MPKPERIPFGELNGMSQHFAKTVAGYMSVRIETTTSLARLHRTTNRGHVCIVEDLVGKPSRGGCEFSRYSSVLPHHHLLLHMEAISLGIKVASFGNHLVGKTSRRGGCESIDCTHQGGQFEGQWRPSRRFVAQ